MNEFPKPEQMSRQQRTNVERISTIVHALTDHIRHTNPSEHFTEPLQPTRSFQVDVPDTREGFDQDGNFHRLMPHRDRGVIDPTHPGYEVTIHPVVERTDLGQLNRWDSMGDYTTDL